MPERSQPAFAEELCQGRSMAAILRLEQLLEELLLALAVLALV